MFSASGIESREGCGLGLEPSEAALRPHETLHRSGHVPCASANVQNTSEIAATSSVDQNPCLKTPRMSASNPMAVRIEW